MTIFTKKAPLKEFTLLILIVGLIVQGVVLSRIYREFRVLKSATPEQRQLIYNEIDGLKHSQRVVISPKDDRVYIPELKIYLPFNKVTKHLLYSFDDERGDARFTSAMLADHEMRIMSCDDMVRVKLENEPKEYSPEQKLHSTLSLSNGQKLQIYISSNQECSAEVWNLINPDQIAQEFTNAKSY